jgi:cytidylate kinase
MALAKRLGFNRLDTGALYRAVAYEAARCRLSLGEGTDLGPFLKDLAIRLVCERGEQRVFVNGRDVTDELRSEEVGRTASSISARPEVRQFLLSIQREMGRDGGLVAEGRDMGTVVFPYAEIKFYLDARLEERAKRRSLELYGRGLKVDEREIEQDLVIRDRRDSERACAPLAAADDAVVIDSTNMGIDDVVNAMMQVIRERGLQIP